MAAIAFLDLEASGLGAGSWPIEVGWCFEQGAPETLLIAPDASWSDAAWDPQAEALHGLTLEKLRAKGASPEAVCKRINAAIGDALVYSDAPDWDGFWLYRLFGSAKVRQRFNLLDFSDLLTACPADQINAARAKADALAPHQHRAAADVRHMRMIYRLLTGGGAAD
ncbi:MAG: hypothetical protein AAGD92_09885 [Pseudomonadota bacterium]